MKTLKVFERVVLEKTGFRKHPYKEVKQISIVFDGKEYKNHEQQIDNPRLRVPFYAILKTRNKKEVQEYLNHLGRSEADKFAKEIIVDVIG